MKKITWTCIGLLTFLGCLYGGWLVYRYHYSMVVEFSGAKGLHSGAPVIKSGLEIGEVLGLKISPNGIDVRLFIDPSAQKLLTTTALFVIAPAAPGYGNVPEIMVKDGAPGGLRLNYGAKIRGVDSVTLWEMSDLSKQLRQMLDEPPLRNFIKMLPQAQRRK